MPVSNHTSQSSPVEVTENDVQFMVKIPAGQRERASKIPGRRWNPEIQRWVYPKTLPVYEALSEEFKRNAAVFDIRKPKSIRLPLPKSLPIEEDQTFEEWQDLTDKTSEIHEKFNGLQEQVAAILGSVQAVETIAKETQDLVKTQRDADKPKLRELKPDLPDPKITSREDLASIEKGLCRLAFEASGRDQSLARWLSKHNPLSLPHKFVSDTHEKVRSSIAAIIGDSNYRSESFHDLANKLKDRNDINPKLIYLLLAMNMHRNSVSHSEGATEAEQQSRSIIYLFNLALVWPHVASEPVE